MKTLTVDSLLRDLGVPASRVLLDPPPGTATVKDVLRYLDAPRKRICELIDGTLVEKAMGMEESAIGFELGRLLANFVAEHELGWFGGPDGTMRLWTGRVRMPDISFFSWDRFPDRKIPAKRVPMIYPDLAIEILSKSNTRKEMSRKRRDLFKAGTRLVWEVDPKARTVTVYTSETDAVVLGENRTLTGGDVLPGFKLPVKRIFEKFS